MKFTNTKVVDFIETKVKIEGTEIKVKSGKCRYNFRCQMNSVHEAMKKGDKQIAMVMCINDKDYPFIHFINIHKGEYVDNTLGVWTEKYSHFLIKTIDEQDFWSINTMFGNYEDYLQSCIPFYLRWFSDITF